MTAALDKISVSESMCQSRTREIISTQGAIMGAVTEIKTMVAGHVSWHDGMEAARSRSRARAGMAIRWLGLGLTAFMSIGGIIWYLGRSIG